MTARKRRFPGDLKVYGAPGDVSAWDLRFDPADRAHLDADHSGRLRIRVWAEPGLTEGMIVTRIDGEVVGYPMTPVATTIRFTFWEVKLDPPAVPFHYSFAFRSTTGRPVYLVRSGTTNAVERLDRWRYVGMDAMALPSWSAGAVVYQIFPDRFANGDPGHTAATDRWGAPPHPLRFQGGDLAGISGRLDHLEALGVDALYLNPIFTSPSTHRYDAIDYYTVDPALGGNEAFRTLVDSAHRRGMKVILDTSFNHVHPRFFAFQDLVRNGRRSPYRDWFVVEEWPLEIRYRPHLRGHRRWIREWLPVWREEIGLPLVEVGGPGPPVEPTYQSWYGTPTMPRIDLSNPDARRYMLDVARHWVSEYRIDGWRMDVARYVDPDFWDDFRRAVREVDPDVYLLAEIVGNAGPWLQGDRFDATMNYTFRDLCLRFFARDEIEADELLDHAARLWAGYAWGVTLANHNLLGSHDTPRFLHESGEELWRLRLATVFQLTFPGAPGIYYGDEVGLSGGDDPGCRGAFPWDGDVLGHPVARTIAELTKVRRREPSLVRGEWRPLHGRGGLVVFERSLGRRRVLVAINRDRREAEVEVTRSARVMWGEGTTDAGTARVSGRAALVVKL